MPSVALITSQYALTSELDADREIHTLRRALQDRGITCELVDWRNPDADLGATDLVVLKSPWDYASRAAEFLSWLDRTPAAHPGAQPPRSDPLEPGQDLSR